ncbi:MAG: 5-formyltetrahydrofolate cyclo-ligase [Cyanobacteria bacterium KgW148]|nr:5-formyltetrahydrofolate cyclo-ligase [Cyanobacteria bacterium KgW148]
MGTEQVNSRLRRDCQKQRLQLSDSAWQERSRLIRERLGQWQLFQNAAVVLSFVSHRREPDLSPLCQQFPDKTWAFPRCHQDQLYFHAINRSAALIPNAWGIGEPPPTAPLIIPERSTLCLVPGLVFDRRGYRLGFGKGYYDRFLAQYPHCIKVGVFFQEFLIDSLQPRPWDIPMHYLAHDRAIDPVQN